jgi:hypothetical protein
MKDLLVFYSLKSKMAMAAKTSPMVNTKPGITA